uniref:PE-PGRS family protein n=1 Tax=Parastrongyloides trichosuri TaxID=131310 RepID=A0A0N4ZDY0_PARTI
MTGAASEQLRRRRQGERPQIGAAAAKLDGQLHALTVVAGSALRRGRGGLCGGGAIQRPALLGARQADDGRQRLLGAHEDLAFQLALGVGRQGVAGDEGLALARLKLALHVDEAAARRRPGAQQSLGVRAFAQGRGLFDHRLDLGVQHSRLGETFDRAVGAALAVDQTEQHVHVVGWRVRADQVRPHVELHQTRLLQREGLGVRQGGEDRLLQLQRQIGPALGQAVHAHADALGADRRLALLCARDRQAVRRRQHPARGVVGVGLGDHLGRRDRVAGRGDDVQMLDRHPRVHGPAGGGESGVLNGPAALLQSGDLGLHPALDLLRQEEPPAGPQNEEDGDDGEGNDQSLAAVMRGGPQTQHLRPRRQGGEQARRASGIQHDKDAPVVSPADQAAERLSNAPARQGVVPGTPARARAEPLASRLVQQVGARPRHAVEGQNAQGPARHVHAIPDGIRAQQAAVPLGPEDIDQRPDLQRIDVLGVERQARARQFRPQPFIDRLQPPDGCEQAQSSAARRQEQFAHGRRDLARVVLDQVVDDDDPAVGGIVEGTVDLQRPRRFDQARRPGPQTGQVKGVFGRRIGQGGAGHQHPVRWHDHRRFQRHGRVDPVTTQGHVVDAAEGGLGAQPVHIVGVGFVAALLQRRQHGAPAGQGHARAAVQSAQRALDAGAGGAVQFGRLLVEDVLEMARQGQQRRLEVGDGLGRLARGRQHRLGDRMQRALQAELGPAALGGASAQLLQRRHQEALDRADGVHFAGRRRDAAGHAFAGQLRRRAQGVAFVPARARDGRAPRARGSSGAARPPPGPTGRRRRRCRRRRTGGGPRRRRCASAPPSRRPASGRARCGRRRRRPGSSPAHDWPPPDRPGGWRGWSSRRSTGDSGGRRRGRIRRADRPDWPVPPDAWAPSHRGRAASRDSRPPSCRRRGCGRPSARPGPCRSGRRSPAAPPAPCPEGSAGRGSSRAPSSPPSCAAARPRRATGRGSRGRSGVAGRGCRSRSRLRLRCARPTGWRAPDSPGSCPCRSPLRPEGRADAPLRCAARRRRPPRPHSRTGRAASRPDPRPEAACPDGCGRFRNRLGRTRPRRAAPRPPTPAGEPRRRGPSRAADARATARRAGPEARAAPSPSPPGPASGPARRPPPAPDRRARPACRDDAAYCNASASVRRLVRRSGLVAAPAPAGDGRCGRGRSARLAGGADRRGQDAGGLSAQPDRPVRTGAATRNGAGLGRSHPLSVAAEGPDDRRRTQSDDAHSRDRAEHPRREPHRRHQTVEEAAPARLPARHPADHAGAVGPVLRLGRGEGLFRRPEMRGAGRGPRHLERQARRPAGAGAGAVADVRAADAAGGAGRGQASGRRPQGRGGRGVVFRADDARRHLRFRRSGVGLPGHRRDRRPGRARRGQGPEDPLLRRLEIPAGHLSGRAGAAHGAGPRSLARPALRRAGVAGAAGPAQRYPGGADPAGRDVSEGRSAFPSRPSVRGSAGAYDAGHAADAAAGPDGRRPAGLCGDGLFSGHLVDPTDRRHRPGRPVRAGHAGRRSGGLAGGELHDEAVLPQLRPDLGPDRAAPAGSREDRPPSDLLDGPDLRRAAAPPAGPSAAEDSARGCGDRPAGRGAVGPTAEPHPRPHRP